VSWVRSGLSPSGWRIYVRGLAGRRIEFVHHEIENCHVFGKDSRLVLKTADLQRQVEGDPEEQ